MRSLSETSMRFHTAVLVLLLVPPCALAAPLPRAAAAAASMLAQAREGTPAKTPLRSDEEAIEAVGEAVRQAHLTTLSGNCLAYRVEKPVEPRYYEVSALETHEPGCGGDPSTMHRLFTIKVDKRTRQMWTDGGIPDDYHPLKLPAR